MDAMGDGDGTTMEMYGVVLFESVSRIASRRCKQQRSVNSALGGQ